MVVCRTARRFNPSNPPRCQIPHDRILNLGGLEDLKKGQWFVCRTSRRFNPSNPPRCQIPHDRVLEPWRIEGLKEGQWLLAERPAASTPPILQGAKSLTIGS